MALKKVVTGVLVLSLAAWALPARAETPGGSATGTGESSAPTSFKASVDRAIASVAKETRPGLRPLKVSDAFTSAAAGEGGQMAPSGGGGMSKVALIMTVVGTAAGLAGTYYMIKEIKKVQTGVPTTGQ
jgi:hypothetical protein